MNLEWLKPFPRSLLKKNANMAAIARELGVSYDALQIGCGITAVRVRQIYRLGCDFHIQVHDLRMLDIASRSKSNCGYLLDI